jgi:hypothetical protein
MVRRLIASRIFIGDGLVCSNVSGSKISALSESDTVADRGHQSSRNERPKAWNFHESATCIVLLRNSLQLGVGCSDPRP